MEITDPGGHVRLTGAGRSRPASGTGHGIEENVDMIVMGTHGRSGLSRLILGSVAESVMRHAPCPVLTYRLSQKAVVESAV